MLVDVATFRKRLEGSEWIDYGRRRVRVAGVLHLIALKLHALRNADRALLAKDYVDILSLIRRNALSPASPELLEILNRYATDSIRKRLLQDLRQPL